MDRIFESGAAVGAPTIPAVPSSGYAQPGNPGTGTPATKPGAWWFHMVTEELRNAIVAFGLTPTGSAINQLATGIASLIASVAAKADLASPAFTGNPTAPTPAAGDNDTSIATTAFVNGAYKHWIADISVASANSLTLASSDSQNILITGTTTINSLGAAAAGIRKTTRFAGALQLTHNGTSLILRTGANITTAANDVAEWESLGGGNWIMLDYSRASGAALVTTSAASQAQMESASSTTEFSSPGRQHNHPGHPKAWAKINAAGTILASYGISGVTKNSTGDYTFTFSTAFSGSDYGIVTGFAPFTSATGSQVWRGAYLDTANLPTTTTCRIVCRNFAGPSNTVGAEDPTNLYVAFYGDQ